MRRSDCRSRFGNCVRIWYNFGDGDEGGMSFGDVDFWWDVGVEPIPLVRQKTIKKEM